jgi:MFS family permease
VADRRGRKPVLVPALAGLAVATAVLGQAPTPLLLGVLLAVLGLMSGAAGVPPGAMLSDVAPASVSGTAVPTAVALALILRTPETLRPAEIG